MGCVPSAEIPFDNRQRQEISWLHREVCAEEVGYGPDGVEEGFILPPGEPHGFFLVQILLVP